LVSCNIRIDITDRKMAEQELQKSEQQFRVLFNEFKQGTPVHRHCKALFANQALANIYGYDSPEEILKLETTIDLIATQDQAGATNQEAGLKGAPAPTREEYRVLRKDGTEFWVSRRGFLTNWDGEPAICSVRVDISDRKNAEIQISESEERHRNFAADVAHQLRTPLSALLLQLEGLTAPENVTALKQDVNSMSRLVEQLLSSARLDTLVIRDADIADLSDVSRKVTM
jgi:PAS domain S-box-containing protein